METKKSQVTLFMIIMLVLFIIIGFLFYLTKYASKKHAAEETKETQKMKFDLHPIENYVVQCLERTTKEGLLLLGSQGGRIYKAQGGLQIDYQPTDEGVFFVKYNNKNVAYGIKGLQRDIGPYFAEVPAYPWLSFPKFPDFSGAPTTTGEFGINKLPPLTGAVGLKSIKSQLESYIENNLGNCLQWEFFEGYEIKGGEMKANVTLAKEEVVVHLMYPLKIKQLVSGNTAEMKDFFAREEVRLKKIYDYAYNLVEADINDIDFNLKGVAGEGGLNVNVVEDVFGQDDIIIIKDTNSVVNTRPYEFIFARKNRPPALEYISNADITITEGENLTASYLPSVSLLEAHDPDEDEITSESFYVWPRIQNHDKEKLVDFTPYTVWFDHIITIGVVDGPLGGPATLEDYQNISVTKVQP
jgi:hypothetical protein